MKLALGTVQFGLNYGIANKQGQVSHEEARSIIDRARASGMNTMDTAIAYCDSERRLGEIGISDWRVVSKLPAVPDTCGDVSQWVTDALHGSLQRLKIKRLYGLLLHKPQQLLEQDGDSLYRSLQQLKRDRLVQKIGVSIYGPEELETLCSRYQFDIVQAPFNIMDRRLIDSGWLPRLAELGIELHARSVFLQGLLLMTPRDRPGKFNRWASLWSNLETWLTYSKLTPLQACLRYAVSFPEINKVVIGVDSLNQLEEILRATAGPMPQVPPDLQTRDVDLLNPARWAAL
ncbi:MAG: aldo/keto reductase [Nitrospiraceae bacterium]